MKVPSIIKAEALLDEAEKMNPGTWVMHNKVAGKCAMIIAENCNDIDPATAYVLGLLHDIGRRNGITDMRHIIDGYNFMMENNFDDSALICLTHSFPYKNVKAYNGENDCNEEETRFIQNFISNIEYNDYDRLIQLCDAISFPNGVTYIEKRLVDVVIRKGFNELTIPKWKSFLDLKTYFDEKAKTNIYSILHV
ncbi:MAG: phosphohydrolase [Eubacteriales bacterium]